MNAKELREELKKAEEHERKADEANRKKQSEAWELIQRDPDNWEWSVAPAKARKHFVSGNNEEVDGARVQCRIKPEILAKWLENGFGTFSLDYQDPNRWFGMVYHRTDEGILTQNSGGHCVLNEPMLCNDEEWAAILRNEIPMKYRR
jgi:hypothetical protein